MGIRIKWSALRETRWYEYLIRFALGGLVTAGTGAIANLFGPETGGLFLAFPAIFGASATLIEKLERERKERAGLQRQGRGRLRRSGRGPGEPGPACLCGLGLGAGSPLAMGCSAGSHRSLGRGVDILVVHSAVDMEVCVTSRCFSPLWAAKPAISSRAA